MNRRWISGCNTSLKSDLLWLALGLLLLITPQAFAADPTPLSPPAGAASRSVTFRDGRLTVETRGESLGDVLAEIQRTSGIGFHVRKTLPTDALSASVRDAPVEAAIQRLLGRDFDLIWFYTAPEAGKGVPALTEVWVVGRGERMGGALADTGKGPARGQPTSSDRAAVKETLGQIETLAKEDPGKALPLLHGHLNDRDPRIRAAAAEALGGLSDLSAIDALGTALANDPDADVREAVAEALGEMGSPKAVQVLRAGLRDTDEDVREAVVDALGQIGGPEAERVLRLALADSNEDIRDAAVAALANLKQQVKKK